MDSAAFLVLSWIAIGVLAFLLFLALFEPGLDYKISAASPLPIGSEDFLRVLEAITDSKLHHRSRFDVLTNGEVYYPAELEAIRTARESVNLEAYIFQKGKIGSEFIEALTERARAGVQVRVVLDAIGSFATWESYFADLIAGGGRVAWYHPLKWNTIDRFNYRTHREIIVIDGRVAFIGGSGIADHWLSGVRGPRWRDTMFRVEGDAVAGIQATFVENWLEASGEILSGREFFPVTATTEGSPALIVDSSPTTGRSTRARILYQTLIASAETEILITTPYFLPDWSARQEMVRAIKDRGVAIRIIVPGKHIDHLLTRRSSRRLFGDLLRAGARIYEYDASMLHAKTMIIDGLWSVAGSTNFDNRSFGLNDEINLAVRDAALAARLRGDFETDLTASREITLREWKSRPIGERIYETLGSIIERQQ